MPKNMAGASFLSTEGAIKRLQVDYLRPFRFFTLPTQPAKTGDGLVSRYSNPKSRPRESRLNKQGGPVTVALSH